MVDFSGKKKYACLLSHAEKIRVGQFDFFFFLILFFINELMMDGTNPTLEECHLTRFCQNNYPLDTKNYIGRQK